MRLTLLAAKQALKHKAPTDKLEWRLNRACERLLGHGKFKGAVMRLALIARYGQLTPPRFVLGIQGVKPVCGPAIQIANRWYDFMPGRCSNVGFCMNLVRDLGDGHAVLYDLPTGGNLVSDVSHGSPVMTITGYDTNFLPVTLNMTGDQTNANLFTAITRVHKEQKTVVMRLKHVDADLVETPLVIMEGSEEETFYHRYRVDGLANVEEKQFEAICKRRHIEFTSEQDILPFSNLSALELTLDALQYEAENDLTTSNKYLGIAVDILNRELTETNSDNDIPTIQFRWPGGAPNFSFGY